MHSVSVLVVFFLLFSYSNKTVLVPLALNDGKLYEMNE